MLGIILFIIAGIFNALASLLNTSKNFTTEPLITWSTNNEK